MHAHQTIIQHMKEKLTNNTERLGLPMYCTVVQLYLTRSALNARTENLRLHKSKAKQGK